MEPFGIVVIVVAVVGLLAGLLSLIGRGSAYEQIGRGSFALDREGQHEQRHGARRPPTGAADPFWPADAQSDADPFAHAREPSLESEVRMLVEVRNARRLRNGEPPLDVEAEVARQLRDLSDM